MEQIKMEEIEHALKSVQVGKASRGENIFPELIKWMSEEGKRWLHSISKYAWN